MRSLKWRTHLLVGSLCMVTATNAQTLDLQVATELDCDLSVKVWSKSGNCPSTAGPYASQCVNLTGPGSASFTVPAPYPNVYQIDLYCGTGCSGTPIAVWVCASGTTEGECCEETVGLYGNQDPNHGWRIY